MHVGNFFSLSQNPYQFPCLTSAMTSAQGKAALLPGNNCTISSGATCRSVNISKETAVSVPVKGNIPPFFQYCYTTGSAFIMKMAHMFCITWIIHCLVWNTWVFQLPCHILNSQQKNTYDLYLRSVCFWYFGTVLITYIIKSAVTLLSLFDFCCSFIFTQLSNHPTVHHLKLYDFIKDMIIF